MTKNKTLRKLVGASCLSLAAMSVVNLAYADTWRYAHEEYDGDVQDVYAHKFKEYVEENSDHNVQVFRFGETTSWSRPRRVSCSS